MLFDHKKPLSPLEKLHLPHIQDKGVELWIKRDDLLHEFVSGNKFRKLKYNLIGLNTLGKKQVLTFGGPFSNHIYALASACALYQIPCTAIIRGEIDEENPTLQHCLNLGMKLISVSRSDYSLKTASLTVQNYLKQFPDTYVIPEGGSNQLALQGVAEIVDEIQETGLNPDYYALASGTGGTTAGILTAHLTDAKVLSFVVLKNIDLFPEIIKWLHPTQQERLILKEDYHFGGYAKWNSQLITFSETFKSETGIALDHVYNAKAMFGLLDMIQKDYFPKKSKIVYIHTGGLQGEAGRLYLSYKKNKM